MVELLRSNDLVTISWAQAMLAAAGIACELFDDHASAIDGSIGALPRRLMVAEADLERARTVLREAATVGPGGEPAT